MRWAEEGCSEPVRHRAESPGTATVLDVHRAETDQTFVLTTDQGFHSIPGSRLLLVRRSH